MATATAPKLRFLTAGDVAERIGCQAWRITRLFERGILPPCRQAGRVRFFEESDVPTIRNALVKAGYLKKKSLARC